MLRSREVAVRAGWLILLLFLPRLALAHSTQPAVWQSLAADAQGSVTVLLSEGLGLRRADGTWRFTCSARWRGPSSPMAVQDAAGAIWGVGHEVVWRVDSQGQAPHADPSGLDVTAVRGIATSGPQTVVLTMADAGADVWTLATPPAPAQVLWHDPGPWTSLVADADGFWLAGARPTALALAHLPLAGSVTTLELPLDPTLANFTPRLRISAGRRFAILSDGSNEFVGRIDGGAWQPLGEDPATILGPLQIAGAVYIAHGGAILRVDADAQPITDASRYFTCLGEDSAGPYACARTDLRTVGSDGVSGAIRFDIAWLTPPSLAGLAPEDTPTCWTEWQNFSRDAGLPEGVPAVDVAPPATTPQPRGCQTLPQPGLPTLWTLLVPLLLLWRKRV